MRARAGRLSRGVAIFAASILSITMATAAPSSAAGNPRSTPPSQRPTRTATVSAKAEGDGSVRVAWNKVPTNVAGVDITRNDGSTTKTLAQGIKSHRFFDSTATPGVAYTYQVTVSHLLKTTGQKTKVAAVQAKTGQVLGSSTVTLPTVSARGSASAANHSAALPGTKVAKKTTSAASRPNHLTGATAATQSARARVHTTAAHTAANIAPACVIGDGTTVFTVPAGTTTWSPATCPNGVEVDSDVVVPAGATLVVAPATVVYFNTATTGDDADGVTNKVDLIARGGSLVLDGTPGGVIQVTSLMENPTYASATPATGDWGGLLARKTGSPNTTSVTFDNVSARYGTGIAFDGVTPAVTSSRVEKMSGAMSSMAYRTCPTTCSYSSMIEFFNPPSGSTVNVDRLILVGDSGSEGFDVYSPDLSVNGFTVNLTNSSLTGNFPFWTEDNSAGTNAQVVAHITNNYLEETGSGDAAEVIAYENPSSGAALADPVGFASVTGDITGNTVRSNSGDGFYVGADNYEGSASHDVDYYNNHVRTYGQSSYNYADSYGNDGSATVGYDVVGGDYWSLNREAWYDDVYASGGRDATAAPSFHGVYLESQDDDGLYVYAESSSGNATATPTLENTTIKSYNVSAYVEAYTGGGSGTDSKLGQAVLTADNSSFTSTDDDTIDIYGENEGGGSSIGNANITDSKTDAYDTSVYADNYAYGLQSSDSSVSNGTITGSLLYSRNSDAVDLYDYQYTQGSAFTTPKITDSLLVADDGDGVYAYAYADPNSVVAAPVSLVTGQALSAPVVTNSTIQSYYKPVYSRSRGYNAAHAYSTPYVIDSSLLSKDDRALESYATASGPGDAKALPYVLRSTLTNVANDDVVDVYGYAGDGLGEAGGTFLDSTLTGDDDGIYADSSRGGTSLDGGLVITDPIVKNSDINVVWDSGLDTYAFNDNGSAKNAPLMYGGTITAIDDYGLYSITGAVSQIDGTEGINTPSFDGVVMDTGDGVYMGTFDGDYFSSGITTQKALEHTAGKFNGGSVSARWDYGFQFYSAAVDSTAGAVTNTLVNDVPVYSYDGIRSETYTYGCYDEGDCPNAAEATGPALDQTVVQYSRPLLLESWWDWGFDAEAASYTQNGGSATEASTLRGAVVRSYDNIYTGAYAEYADATNQALIVDNTVDRYTGNDDNGININAGVQNADTGTATNVSTVAGNSISNVNGAGIAEYAGVPSGTEDFNNLISGNTIHNVSGQGIVESSNGNTDSADVTHITRNVTDQTQNDGIGVQGIVPDIRSNTVSRSAWTANGGSRSGIAVASDPGTGLVACNTLTQNSTGITYSGNTTDPATNENNFADQAGLTNKPWNLNTDSSGTTDATGNWWGVTGAAIGDTVNASGSGIPDISGARDDTACRGGYELDGYGAPHPYGPGTAAVDPGSSPYFGFDIARAIGVWGDGASGEVLDGFGAVHPFNGAPVLSGQPYFFKSDGTNNDIARDIALRDDGTSGYELDGYGKVWALGGAPEVNVTYYQYANDFARRMVLRPDGQSGYVITADGVMHPFAVPGAPLPPATMVGSPGAIKDVIGNHDGHSGYVLGASGALVPWNTALGSAAPTTGTPLNLYGLAKAATWFNDAGRFVLDARGAVHPSVSNGLPLNAPTPYPYFGFDIARDLDGRA